jgi:Na+/H+ antiporter NhaB
VFVQIFKILQVETELSTPVSKHVCLPIGDYCILPAFLDKNAVALTFITVKSDVSMGMYSFYRLFTLKTWCTGFMDQDIE